MLHGHGMNNHGFQLICIYIAGDKLFLNVSTSYYFYRIKWQIYHICPYRDCLSVCQLYVVVFSRFNLFL